MNTFASPRAGTDFDFADVQGLLRFGHGRLTAARLLLLRIRDPEAARAWLRRAPVTSGLATEPPPATALQVAFTVQGLRALGLAPQLVEQFSEEFIAGMHEPNRARSLGDAEASAPAGWRWGGDEAGMPHVLVLLYALPGGLDAWQAGVADAGFTAAFEPGAPLETSPEVRREPFGFADGISQPAIDWRREQTTDNHRRDRYSNLLALGEVVLGYPNEYGEYTARPLVAAQVPGAALLPLAEDQPGAFDLGRNGSYLVLRQLEQDVGGFWRFVDERAGHDAAERERLAEAMVGRRRDGSPLVPPAQEPIPGIEPGQQKNHFAFDGDPHGVACPIAAHVRRSNPRTGDFPFGVNGWFERLRNILGFDPAKREQDLVASTRFHRILRRGRAYGPPSGTLEDMLRDDGSAGERGLHFICLAANIRRQFEFVQGAWSVSGKFGGLQDEEDCVTGSRQPLFGGTRCNQFSRPRASGVRHCVAGIPRFVTVRGGAYFFLPGLRALQFLAAEPTARGGGVS